MLRLNILPLILGVLMPVSLRAAERYYSDPLSLDAGTVLTETVPPAMSSWNYHCRVQPAKRTKSPRWSFSVKGENGSRYTLTITRQGITVEDADYAQPIEVILEDDRGAILKRFNLNRDIDNTSDALSLVLEKRAGCDSIDCRIGQRLPIIEFTAFAADDVSSISLKAESTLGLLRLSLTGEEAETGGTAAFDSVERLDAYLSASGDNTEKRWRYLDRDTDARVLNLGGEYRLATVSNADGGYDVVYIDGARVNSAYWKPMMIKGRLLLTVFVNHYDLIWYDAYGRVIDCETSADIENGSILKLNFPLYGGSVRFAPEFGK